MELWILDCSEGVVLVDTGMSDNVIEKIKYNLAFSGKNWVDVEIVLIAYKHGDQIRNLARTKKLTSTKIYSHETEAPAIKEQIGRETEGLVYDTLLLYCRGIEVIHVCSHTEARASPLKKLTWRFEKQEHDY
jgi:glyoxylase-like metal-dependent hydrolase (beta-lactamase superfamily II)